jgi:hypothetical protein
MWNVSTTKKDSRICANCRHFVDDPEVLERELPGINILSSTMGDTRGDQGICTFHEQLLAPTMTCENFWARELKT